MKVMVNGSGANSGSAFPANSVERFFRFSLLGLLASGYLALAGSGQVDAAILTVTGSAIVLRALLDAGVLRWSVPGRWITAATLACIGFYPLDYLFVSGGFLAATVHLVLFLAVVKVLTARTGRDYLFVAVIAFLELLAASLVSARLNYFLFLALFLLCAVASLASWEIRRVLALPAVVARRESPAIGWRLATLAVLSSLGILAITAGLFFFLPRTARAAFERLAPENFRLAAFSNQVTLGRIGRLKRQTAVLMHVRIPGVKGVLHLKWRGTALSEFDGKKWYNPPESGELLRVRDGLLRLAGDAERRRKGTRLNYEVQLKPFVSDLLFIAGQPEFIRVDSLTVRRTPEDGYRIRYGNAGVIRYGVLSFLEPTAPRDPFLPAPTLSPARRQIYLRLPPIDPRTRQLARRITADCRSPAEKARALENYLRTSYTYTLELPREAAADPVAQFLFDRRRGHCEYFASAMAVMLRTIGIPSRVATGFESGVFNPISGWYVIRASDAHSWVEAFLPGRGWATFDPTPAGAEAGAVMPWTRLSMFVDAADTFWQNWVLSYDLNRQLALASRVGRSGRGLSAGWIGAAAAFWAHLRANAGGWLKRYGSLLAGAVLGLLAALAFAGKARRWVAERRRLHRVQTGKVAAADATLLYRRALELLRRRGREKPAWLTPFEFARLIPAPETAGVLQRFTLAYNELRFGGRKQAAADMIHLLGELERALRRE